MTKDPFSSPQQGRDARYDGIVQMLRDRVAEDRDARAKRERFWYLQTLESDARSGTAAPGPWTPRRLHTFGTKVPCRATPEALALLDELKSQFPGSSVTFPRVAGGRQAVMLSRSAGVAPRQIGWVDQAAQRDPKRCNVRDQGLVVETDGGKMLVLRFLYPSTGASVTSRHPIEECTRCVDFAEVRPALALQPAEKASSPSLVWLSRPENETLHALESRDYETFYVRFKLEVQAGLWSALTSVLAGAPASQWHRGACYTVVREPDATNRRIHQRTLDDSGAAVDIGADRTYDAARATDILLLYLDGDILADLADIYFTIQGLASVDAWFLKEEFFTAIRRCWAGAESLASSFGSDFAAVLRMAQRAVPTPAQVPLLQQDWANLRQSLLDRYGDGGRKAADLVGRAVYDAPTGPAEWPFATFTAGDINVGLRLVHRQEWRPLGAVRGEVIHTFPAGWQPLEHERADSTPKLDDIMEEAVKATVHAMKWTRDYEGGISTAVRGLASRSAMGLESECRDSGRDTCARLSDLVRRYASALRAGTGAAVCAESSQRAAVTLDDDDDDADKDAPTYVCRRMQHRYEIVTRPAELQNVVLVAEQLPAPAEINRAWALRHAPVLATVWLDESLREVLDAVSRRDASISREKLERLCEHLRANILHYQQCIWQREDAQHRSMRYRKSGKKVPLEWRFELRAPAALTIDELGDRLAAPNVDGQFAAYSAGREADLDQVIDPAGPIGYYANCAIYRMRPEFGSDDLFPMLHFFKSPWLHPDASSGEPEVADPDEIALGADHAALKRCRRERARRFTRDGIAIELLAPVTAGGGKAQDAQPAFELPAEGFQIVLDGSRGLAPLRATTRQAGDGAWTVLRRGERARRIVGATWRSGAPVEHLLLARGGALRAGTVRAHGAAFGARSGEVLVPSRVAEWATASARQLLAR